jgi:hypothetical protein
MLAENNPTSLLYSNVNYTLKSFISMPHDYKIAFFEFEIEFFGGISQCIYKLTFNEHNSRKIHFVALNVAL